MFGTRVFNSLSSGAGIIAAALFLAEGAAYGQQGGPVKVLVSEAKLQDMSPQIEVPGTVISRNDARLAVDVSGTVDWVAEVGTQINAGDVVARLDATLWKLEVAESEATVRRLEAELKFQKQELDRLTRLAVNQTVSQARVDEVTAQRDMTAQDLEQARVRLERSAYRLHRSEVRAPFPGMVAARLVELGEYAAVGQEIARVVDTGHLDIRAQIPIVASPYLKVGGVVLVDGGRGGQDSSIRAIVPVGDEVTRTFEVRIETPNPNWVVGSAVRVKVPTGEAQRVVSVPRDAVVLRADNSFVFCVVTEKTEGPDGTASEAKVAKRVVVRTGSGRGAWVEVLDGAIKVGDTVIVRGAESLQPGQAVEIAGSA